MFYFDLKTYKIEGAFSGAQVLTTFKDEVSALQNHKVVNFVVHSF